MRKRLALLALIVILLPAMPLVGLAWLLGKLHQGVEWLSGMAAGPFIAAHNWLARRVGEREIG